MRVDDVALDPRQHLVAVGVDAVVDNAGSAGEADLLQVAQQSVNGNGPWPGGPPDGPSGTDDVTGSSFSRTQRLEG